MLKPAITQVSINETIANRWSGRAYDASKQVSHEQIIALLEAARWAPSCFGDEPWRFIVWDKNTDKNGQRDDQYFASQEPHCPHDRVGAWNVPGDNQRGSLADILPGRRFWL